MTDTPYLTTENTGHFAGEWNRLPDGSPRYFTHAHVAHMAELNRNADDGTRIAEIVKRKRDSATPSPAQVRGARESIKTRRKEKRSQPVSCANRGIRCARRTPRRAARIAPVCCTSARKRTGTGERHDTHPNHPPRDRSSVR